MAERDSSQSKEKKKKMLRVLCNQPDCLQMWLAMEAEGEGPDGRPIPLPPYPAMLSDQLFVFQERRRRPNKQAARPRLQPSVSCCRSQTAVPNSSAGRP